MKRVLIIANKAWETEPALNALLNAKFKHEGLLLPEWLDYPKKKAQGEAFPRAVWKLSALQCELWCIENIMTPNPDPGKYPGYYSSSAQKIKDLPKIFSYSQEEVALIIAFGTAGYPSEVSRNGSVVIGSNVFIYNAHPAGANPESHWDDKRFGSLISSKVDNIFLALSAALDKEEVRAFFDKRLLSLPLPATMNVPPKIIINKSLVALSNVNITRYSEYKEFGEKGIAAAREAVEAIQLGSVETTHGVIRLFAESVPFLFISSIVDRVGFFEED